MPTQLVVAPPARASMFITMTVPEGSEREARAVLAGASDLAKSVSFRSPDADLLVVLGIGSELWDRMIDAPKPRDLHVLPEIHGAKHTAVSTPGDILLHLRAARPDICFEYAHLLAQQFGTSARIIDEVHGFKFYDDRDLLGFVDGTANPEGSAADTAALVDETRDPDYAGSSYVVVQKYLHDLDAWQALSVEQQERVIGRYKLNNVEIPDDLKATDSHVMLNTITDEEGVEHDIVRDNQPFGRIGESEFGTYFIGYAANPLVIEQMLRNMFIGRPEGHYDRILDYSTAATGALFFVPTQDFLDSLEDLPLPAAGEPEPEDRAVPGHAEDSAVIGAPDRLGADDQETPDSALDLGPFRTTDASAAPSSPKDAS